jgi:GABA permease
LKRLPAAITPAQELTRSLRPRHVTLISLGGIIGAGLFVGSGTAITTAGPAVVVSYLIAGAVLLLVMRILTDLAAVLPGVHVFTEFPRVVLGGRAGFVAGWLYWYFWAIVIPVEAIAAANLLAGWLSAPVWVLGAAIIGALVAVNLLAVRWFGELESGFAGLKVAALCGFIVLVAAYVLLTRGASLPVVSQLTGNRGLAPHGVSGVLAASVTAFFSLTGAEVATVAAAEAVDPARVLRRTTKLLAIRVLVFYLISIVLILCVVPWNRVQAGISPFSVALAAMGLPQWRSLLSAVIFVAILSTLNAAFYVCSRTLFVLAKNGDAPRWLVHLDRRRVPARSLVISALGGLVGVGADACFPRDTYAFLVNASGAVMVFLYALIALSQIKLRRVKLGGFPWGSYVALSIMAILLLAMAVTPALRADLYFSGLALLTAWIISARGGPGERPASLDSHKRPCCTNGARAHGCDRGTEGCR